jgi:hypothetical protein
MFNYETNARLDSVIELLKKLLQTGLANQEKLMADLTALTAAVAANTTAVNSAVAALTADGSEPAALAALTAQLTANNTALTNAVTPPVAAVPPVAT